MYYITRPCVFVGSCPIGRDWSEEMWSISHAQPDKRFLANLVSKPRYQYQLVKLSLARW